MFKKKERKIQLFSAALQDHIMKRANFCLDNKLSFPKHRSVPRQNKLQPLQKREDVLKLLNEREAGKVQMKIEQQQQRKYKVYRDSLTLAQKMGLVQAPPGPMRAQEWAKVEERSKKRHDSEGECVICLQKFKDGKQVILSCSHVFHMACLKSFQKHNRIKACPICRLANYQEKQTIQGIKAYGLQCIIKIQAQIRMHRQNLNFFQGLIGDGYKPKTQQFGRRLVLYKMSRLSTKLRKRTLEQQRQLEQLFRKIQTKDKPDAEKLFDQLMLLYSQKLKFAKAPSKTDVKWSAVEEKALARQQPCSICLNALEGKVVSVLSCSHAFHRHCMDAFQRYGIVKGCPNCRKPYERREVQL